MRETSILLVDDEKLILESLGLDLEEAGFSITKALNGTEALKFLQESSFDVIVTDLVMEDIDGLQILREAKRNDPGAIVIILTAYGDMSSAIEALRHGASDYILKPYNRQTFFLRIEKSLENKDLHLQLEKQKKNLLEINGRLKHAEEFARQKEHSYFQIFHSVNDAIILHDPIDSRILDANRSMCQLLGYTLEELLKLNMGNISSGKPPYTQQDAIQWIKKTVAEGPQHSEWHARKKTGELLWLEVHLKAADINSSQYVLAVMHDITEKKKLHDLLEQSNKRLEIEVEQKTRDLRKKTEEQNKTLQELKLKTDDLMKSNIALEVLLQQSHSAKHDLEEKINVNIKELVNPYLDELDIQLGNRKAAVYVDILRKNIDKITSSFTKKLSSKLIGLTPRELQVADLVKQGRSNKDIAELLMLSPGTVELYRSHIRKKLGIKNKKINLRAYLLTHE